MQLLIVHRDPEMGEALVQMIKDYTHHHAQLVESDKAALDWARHHQRCELLLVQLESEGINGLALGSALSEIFPALQVLFFPNYAASDRRLEVTNTKIFPEPIEGDELLGAIERAENSPPNAPDLFHVVDVLQMCCLSRRSGALQMVKDSKNGLVYLRNGRIVHAETTTARGRDVLAEIVRWKFVEFAYERSVRPPLETITGAWHEILIDIVGARKREGAVESQRQSA
jgi:DNA-binding NarL/FixJ family response regulator